MNDKPSSPVPDNNSETNKSQSRNPVISADLSRKLTAVSFFTACFVVINHSYIHQHVDSQTTTWLMTFLSKNMSMFAVLLFFAVSGYLAAKKTAVGQTSGWYSGILKKRMRTLGIPYLAWCTIYALTFLPFTMLGNHLAGRDLFHNTALHEPLFSIVNIGCLYGLDLWGFPIAIIMWYVRNLILLFLALPFLFPVLRRRTAGLVSLLILFVLYLIQDWAPDSIWQFLETGFSVRGLFFFSIGIYLSVYPVKHDSFRVFRKLLPFIWTAGCAGITCCMLYGDGKSAEFYQVLMKLITMAGVGAVWVLYDMLPAFQRLGELPISHDSFFLYASHYVVISVLFSAKMQDILTHRLHVPELAFYLLKFLIPFTLCLLTAELLKRLLPRVYGILTGGR